MYDDTDSQPNELGWDATVNMCVGEPSTYPEDCEDVGGYYSTGGYVCDKQIHMIYKHGFVLQFYKITFGEGIGL